MKSGMDLLVGDLGEFSCPVAMPGGDSLFHLERSGGQARGFGL